MGRDLNGREALGRIDSAIADLRRALGDAIEAAERAESQRAEVRDSQVKAYRALAGIRLDLIADGPIKALDDLHAQARRLLVAHEGHVESQQAALAAASEKVAALEARRADLLARHDAAIEAFEKKVAEIETSLADEDAYVALAAAAERAASVTARAKQKLDLARQDREEKGAPYEADPLFQYLWKRRFRTTEYKAGPVTRFLDTWVARLCGYDRAYLNYDRLTELPERLAEHVERVEALETDALSRLEAAETKALKEGGAEALQTEAEAILAKVAEVDDDIAVAEAEHGSLARQLEGALKAATGPAADARRLLEDGLKRSSFPDLRVLASETISLDDDRLVDDLVKLRAEEMSLDLEAERIASLPARHREDLSAVEGFRRKFKSARLDSAYAMFSRAAVDRAIVDIVRGSAGPENALRGLRRAMRRLEPRASRGFGGRRRSDTLGLPDVLGEVIWEVVKEAGRQPGRGGWGRPVRRRSPKISFPSGPRRGGGFRTGGGF